MFDGTLGSEIASRALLARTVDHENEPEALVALRQDPDAAAWPEAVWAGLRSFATKADQPLTARELYSVGATMYAQLRGKAMRTVVEGDPIEEARAKRAARPPKEPKEP